MKATRFLSLLLLIFVLIFGSFLLLKAVIDKGNSSPKITYFHPRESTLKNFYEPLPNIKAIEIRDGVDKVVYRINADSLNEEKNYSVDKSPYIFRIIALGDSYTFGIGVPTPKNWVKILERMLNQSYRSQKYKKFEVINLGVDGYDIEYSVERFRLRGIKYNPDLILWFLNDSDFPQVNEIIIPIKQKLRKEMEETGELEQKRKLGDYYPYTKKQSMR
jgi:hypothetical protein